MNGWDRAILYDLTQRPALVVVKNAGDARCLAVQETVGTLGVEAKNPIAHDLQANAANPRRARAAGVNLRKRQKTSGLIGIARSSRQLVQLSRVKVRAKWNRSRHGKTFQKLFAMLNHVNADSGICHRSQTFRDLV